jgi:two-component system, cell cycle sensor histidine kinase and response regulator CckA
MSPNPVNPMVRVVVVEDSADHARHVVHDVEEAGYTVQAQHVQTAEELRGALTQGTWDLVLFGYRLPDFAATEGVAILKEIGSSVPFIVVSGATGENLAVELVRDAAGNVVMRDHPARLGTTVRIALHEAGERCGNDNGEHAPVQDDRRLRNLYDQVPIPYQSLDADGKLLEVNTAWLTALGYTREEALGHSFMGFLSPGQQELLAADLARLKETGGAEGIEYRLVRKDGSTILAFFDVKSSRDDRAGVKRTHWVFTDITERRCTEEQLRVSEADLREAQTLAHAGSWRWDIAHDKLIWSDEMYRIYGVDPQQFIGSWEDVIAHAVHPDDRARVEAANRALMEEHNSQPIEYRIIRPDGSVRDIWDHTGNLLLDERGQIVSLSGVVIDITERKRAEAEKDALQAQLLQAQKMEAIGRLAGGVAHDFNNLLTGILGYIAIIRGDLEPGDPTLPSLNAIDSAAHQAADLAKGLLTFGRQAMVSPVSLDAGEVLDATLTILKQSLPATMTIVRDVEQPAWYVMADRSQITQIILNLAVNARDAMQGKGTLTFRLRNVQVDDTYVQEQPSARIGEFIHLSVQDSGPGIPPEIRAHLFEPFHTTKPVGVGTGLGLSIVYGAVRQSGGWVTADSPPGGGTVFEIYLPRCLEKPQAPVAPVAAAVNVCSGAVLVVEDEPVVSAVAQALLKRSGCSVLAAGDGASAVARFHESSTRIDIVLLDMTMPGMTTDDIVHAIRAIDAHVPILLTSGYTSSDIVQRMLDDRSVQGFLAKPYEPGQLTDNIRKLLRPQ